MEIDTAMAARFLAALSTDTMHTFQTFDDSKRGRRGLTRVLHGTFEKHEQTLRALNLKGAGVFVMVNRGDGRARKADNVTGIRALFVDLDGACIKPVLAAPIHPRIVVESSAGRFHAYWPVADMPPELFSAAQKALAVKFDADLRVHDKPRVMRLPGFLHNKGKPCLTRLIESDAADPLTWAQIVDAFGLQSHTRLSDVIGEGKRNDTLFKMAVSAKQKGVPAEAQVAKALTVNAKRCRPPLADAEVKALVESAYRIGACGTLSIPLELLENLAFKALNNSARMLLVLAYRRADGFNAGCITLPHSELVDLFPHKNTFLATRKRVVKSGLISIAKAPTKAMPRKGRGPKPAFYQLAIGPFCAPYSKAPIGAISATPEALQAVAVVVVVAVPVDGLPPRINGASRVPDARPTSASDPQ